MDKATLKASVSVPEDVVFQELEGEAVLLNLGTGKYYGLDAVGTRMWHTLTEYGRVEPGYQALLERYDVPQEQLRQDLLALLDTLAGYGLLLLSEDQPGA